MNQKVLCWTQPAITLNYIRNGVCRLKGTTSYHPRPGWTKDLTDSGYHFQMHVLQKVSLEIPQMDHFVPELWLSKLDLASINSFPENLRVNDQVRKEHDLVRRSSQKTLLYIDASATSIYMSPRTATYGCYRTERLTYDMVRLKLAISHTLYSRYYRLAARFFTIRNHFKLSISADINVWG